jgi:DNA polymerase-4
MEDRGVDEVYLDFTHTPGGQREGGRVLARLIQKTIQEQTGLTCSIGVAPNKLLAKMCSEFNKPSGLTVLYEEEIESRIWPLACQKINGIGPKASLRLTQLGIHTIAQLAQQPLDALIEHFGKNYGAWLYRVARGIDDKPIERSSEPVSMSRESTFSNDLDAVQDKTQLGQIFDQLCEKVSQDLMRKGFQGKTVGLKIKFNDFKVVTRDITLEQAVCSAQDIARAARQSLKRVDFKRKIRLLGVRVGSLERANSHQPSQLADSCEQLDLDIPGEAR